MPKTIIATPNAPQAIGPYSQAVVHNGLVFVSGQIPIDPKSNIIPAGLTIEQQTRRVLDNLKAVLEAAGSSLDQVLKTTIYLKDMGTFNDVNMIYGQYFTSNWPARATVEVARLPKDVLVEIDAIAACPAQ
ncbi:MAG: RidA family protein [Acidobacteria bacterium]|nr:RidA family protein [Acidobacteriota bacterium]